jgi:hypothetical protein
MPNQFPFTGIPFHLLVAVLVVSDEEAVRFIVFQLHLHLYLPALEVHLAFHDSAIPIISVKRVHHPLTAFRLPLDDFFPLLGVGCGK